MAEKRKAEGPDDDALLWQAVARSVKPLRKRSAPAVAAAASEPESALEAKAKKAPKPVRASAVAKPREPPKPPELPPLVAGRADGVDKRTAQRLRRGQLAVEAILDLHDHTQSQAHAALDGFLADGQGRGLRCVLVITGKGRVSEEGGVLRANLPRWLNQPANRARVVAIAPAQPRDGGPGALYVLLRRKR